MKRIGGSGGLHIHRCPPVVTAGQAPLLPARVSTARRSRSSVSQVPPARLRGYPPMGQSAREAALSLWWRRSPRLTLEADLEVRLIEASLTVEPEFGLRGLVSFDFLIARWRTGTDRGQSAARRVARCSSMTLAAACSAPISRPVAAATQPDLLQAEWHPPAAAAAAYLYADRADLTVPDVVWPDWTADRPIAGSVVQKRQPLATVMTRAGNVDDAERLCRKRLETLETMLYVDPARNGAHL